jgi:acyl-coenzyme A synthetase/AMP-(fatty) acid ligase
MKPGAALSGNLMRSEEIENVIRRHPQVRDVALVQRGAKEGKTEFFAYVAGSASPNELTEVSNNQLLHHEIIIDFYIVKELPRDALGRILHKELEEIDRQRALVDLMYDRFYTFLGPV